MRRQELPALTTLRFPAAFAIVLFHYFAEAKSVPSWVFHNLSLGVSFFYVLSGFILAYNYPVVTDKAGFWIARFARIWPVHLFTLLLVLVAFPFDFILGHASWHYTLPLNFFLLQSWVPFKGSMLSFNGVSWSLSVEAYFYFCFPWLLILFMKWGARPLLAASFLQGLIIIAIGQLILGWPEEYGSFFPACRLFEFVLGMYVCRAWQSRVQHDAISPWQEIISLVMGIGFVMGLGPLIWEATRSLPLAGWFLTEAAALCFAWIIWAFAHHAGPVSGLLSHPFGVQLGQISFSLYMIHQIVQRFFLVYGLDAQMSPQVFFVVYLLLSMAGAYFLFYAVENPARHWIVGLYRRAAGKRPRQPAEIKPI